MLKFLAGSNVAGVAVAGVVVVGGAVTYYATRPAAVVAPVDVAQPVAPQQAALPETPAVKAPDTPAPEVTAEAEPAPATTPEPPAQTAPTLTFDEVRQEPDGTTIIAGQANPGAQVRILQDGTEVASAVADGLGKFAAIAFVVPDGKGHVLSLVQSMDGTDTVSPDQIILAPQAPVQVAEAAPAAPEVPTATQTAPAVAPQSVENETPAAPEVAAPTTATVDVEQTTPAAPVADPEVVVAEAPLDPVTTAQGPSAETPVDPVATPEVTVAEATDPPTPDATAPVTAEEVAPAPQSAPQAETAQVTPEDAPEAPPAVAEAEVAPETQIAEVTAQTPQTPEAPSAPSETASTATATAPADAAAPKVAVLKTTQDGVELLNVPQPEAMDNVALDTISYSQAGDVQLSGRAQAEAETVRVYLNNTSVISLEVDAAGRWRGDLPNVDEGIYTLRVDEVSQSGKVTSRVETPFKREAPEVLAQAAAAQDGPLKQITVQKGATLWGIAEERYGSGLLFVNVFEANGDQIRDPNLIYPGQVFALPADTEDENEG